MARSAPTRQPSGAGPRGDQHRHARPTCGGTLSGTIARASAVVPCHPARPLQRRRPAVTARSRSPRSPRTASHRRGQRPDYLSRTRNPFRDRRGPRSRRHHQPLSHPGADAAGRPLGHRRHRPGQDRYGQDPRFRPPPAGARHRRRRRRGGPGQARAAHHRPAGPRRGPHPRAVPAGHQRPAHRGQGPRRPRPRHIRRPRLRAPGRGAQQGCRRHRRHPGPPARPGRTAQARPRARQGPRPGRGRRDARPRLPAGRRAHRDDARRPSARPCCSRRPCRARSSASPAGT